MLAFRGGCGVLSTEGATPGQWNKAPWLDLGDRDPWTLEGHAPRCEGVVEPPRGRWGLGLGKAEFSGSQHNGVQPSRARGGARALRFAQVPQDCTDVGFPGTML